MSTRGFTHRLRRGFTLMEVVVSLGIFSIISLVIIDIYLGANREERRALAHSTIQHDTRFLVETIARDIRLGTVDYDWHTGTLRNNLGELISPPLLALKLNDGSHVYYRCTYRYAVWAGVPLSPKTCQAVDEIKLLNDPTFISGEPDLETSVDWVNWTPMKLENITLQSVNFIIEPPVNPLATDTALADKIQPRVTIAITGIGRGRQEEQLRTTVQTTVTSRSYGP